MENNKKLFFDKQLLIILIILAATSVLAVASAAPLIGNQLFTNDPIELCIKQIQWFVVSAVFVYGIYRFTSDRVYTLSWIFYGIFMSLLVLLLINRYVSPFFHVDNIVPFARTISGATLWFVFPGIGSLQPSEFMKIAIIIVLAQTIKKHNDQFPLHTTKTDLKLLFKTGIIVLPPCLVNFLLDDVGVTLIIIVSVLFMLFCSGFDSRWFIIGGIILITVIGTFVYLYIYQHDTFTQILANFRFQRLYGWLDPEGTYNVEGYQLFNALLAMGSATIFGHGFQANIIPFPEAQTDFIFAVIAQDFGLIGGLFTLLVIILLDIKLLSTALAIKDERDKYLILGMVGMLVFQQVWNIGMILGLVPITGITLPFISYGGSSLLSYMIIIGMVFDITKRHRIEKSKAIYF